MLTKNILDRVSTLRDKLGPKHSAGRTIPISPAAMPILKECVAILNAIDMPEEIRNAVYYKLLGDSLAFYPPQDAVNLIVVQRMLEEFQDEERLHNSIEGMKRQLVQRASY